MWLATKFGFYSIVRDGIDGGFKVRSRCEIDLKNLCKLSQFKDKKIHFDSKSDYRFRIFISSEELKILMNYFSSSLDYDNFKDKIKTVRNQRDKIPFYNKIWAVMYEYQHRYNFKILINEYN